VISGAVALILIVSAWLGVMWLIWAFCSEPGYILRARLAGKRRIYVKHKGRNSDSFYTIAHEDPFGDLIAYRYPHTKKRQIRLEHDGTGECYGPIEWIDA